jgi:hypothetical protein
VSTGPVPARGRVLLCCVCGAAVVFVEFYADGRKSNHEAARLTRATEVHAAASARCKDGGVFDGPDVAACRCAVPLRMERPTGLFCAKCNGLIAPHLRPDWPPLTQEGSVLCRRPSTRS